MITSIDRKQKYIFSVEKVLSDHECAEFIARIESSGLQAAPVITAFGERIKAGIRNNDRVIFDDKDFAKKVFERLKTHLPLEIYQVRLAGLNERFRGYRYKVGGRFAPHSDNPYERSDSEQSFYTVLLYLNDSFEGGNTTFIVEPEVSIKPKAGMALLFQHPLIHEGAIVTAGVKYVLRTDVMYSR